MNTNNQHLYKELKKDDKKNLKRIRETFPLLKIFLDSCMIVETTRRL